MTKKYTVLTKCIFPAILFLLPLWNAWVGVDVIDTGYSLAYFRFFPELSGMWFFSTFLANLTGWILMQLPGGGFLLGMNLYTSLLISITALLMYYVLAKRVPALIVFAGEALAIFLCWCPTTILYHYLTYLLFSVGALLLFYGLCEGKKKFLVAAGIVLGINAFVRTPSNCLEVFLIVVVWYAGWLNQEKGKEVLKQTFLCVAGYLAAVLVLFVGIGLIYGFDTYVEAVLQMIGSTDAASDYTFSSMVIVAAKNMLEGLVWLLKLSIFFAAGIVVQVVGKKKWIPIKMAICVLFGLGGLFLMMRRGFFDRNYYYHLAVYRPFLIFVWITLGAAIFYLFYKKAEKWERIWAATVLMITLIMPFGTNNHFYANMNTLFLVLPFTLYAVWRFVRYAFLQKKAVSLAAGGILISFLFVFAIQCTGYGLHFVLFDNYEQIKRDTKVNGIETLKGMYTYPENAKELEQLHTYLKEAGVAQDQLLTMGNLPGLYYYLDMPCAGTVLWPDLGTSPSETYEEELEGLSQAMLKGERAPVVIVDARMGQSFLEGSMALGKETALQEFLTKNGYVAGYESNRYMVFIK